MSRPSPEGASRQAAEFTTHGLAGAAQFGAFRAAYGGVFEIFPAKGESKAFPVHQKTWNLDKMVLVCAQLPGAGHAFGWRHARRATLDHWYVLLPLDGPASGAFQDQTAPLSFHCLAKPFRVELEAHGMVMLFVPRDLVAVDLDSMLDRKLDAGAGLLLADFLRRLCRHLPDLRAGELPGVLDAIRSLICACAAPFDGVSASVGNPGDARLIDRAKRLIESRIGEPDLSSDFLCEALFVSRSRLYRAFQPLGGVSTYIRRRRLAKVRDALLDVHGEDSLGHIAEQWGFADASGFSRAFKREFGISPGKVRKAGFAATGLRGGRDAPPDGAEAPGLHALLRRMRS